MVLTNDVYLPSYEELTVPEINVSYPVLKSASQFMGLYCEKESKEFTLCRDELEDPRKCLQEGRDVTNCGIKFLQQLKKFCRPEFERFSYCVDHSTSDMYMSACKPEQRPFDTCMRDYMKMERPPMGYFSRPHIHESVRPKPVVKQRDYKAEAAAVLKELPADYPISKDDYKKYKSVDAALEFSIM